MALNKTRLECPKCHWIFEVSPFDTKHLVASLEKPNENESLNDIKEIEHVCRNPECKESFTVYSYTPIDYFNRV